MHFIHLDGLFEVLGFFFTGSSSDGVLLMNPSIARCLRAIVLPVTSPKMSIFTRTTKRTNRILARSPHELSKVQLTFHFLLHSFPLLLAVILWLFHFDKVAIASRFVIFPPAGKGIISPTNLSSLNKLTGHSSTARGSSLSSPSRRKAVVCCKHKQ